MSDCKTEILTFLAEAEPKACQTVVMPDFFLDRIINLDWTPDKFAELVAGVANRKGGSIDGIPQTDLRGGNAINIASALASLGVEVTPIICTSETGFQQIKYHFKNFQLDFSHIKICGKSSITTALEFRNKEQKANVMLRDLGGLADFSPSDLDDSDFKLIADADYLCLFNWAGTLKHGTELAQRVFESAKKFGEGKTYYDTADPKPNSEAIPELMEKVLKSSNMDILSLNENEAITYANLLDEGLKAKLEHLEFAQVAMEAARILAKHLPARIDLHTTAFSATLKGNKEIVVPTFKVHVLRATGAGDAWNAGNILGDHNGLSDEYRLLLANAVSACYLSDPEGMHPTKNKLSKFISQNL